MSGAPVLPPGKKKASTGSLAGVWFAAVCNAGLGVVVAFAVLAITPPQTYDPKPKKPGDPLPPPPAGVWFWEGKKTGGDWRTKDAAFLAATPAKLVLAESDLNGWAATNFKSTARPAAKPPGPGGAADGPVFAFTPGNLNFRSWAADSAPPYFQAAVPLNLSIMSRDFVIICQARGRFTPGAGGPRFQPFYVAIGSARIPEAGGLGQMVFGRLLAAYAQGDGVKKYLDAWGRVTAATPGAGELVLER